MCLAFAWAMRKSSVFLEPDDAGGHQVLLTLRRGVSSNGAWTFDAPDAGVTIAVGASASCDWQIASPGVSPLFLSFTGEALLARAVKHDDRLCLNGSALSNVWVHLSHGDQIDLGPSTLAVSLARSLQPKESWRERQKHKKAGSQRAQARRTAAAEKEERERVRREAKEQRAAARATALVLRDDPGRSGAVLFREREPEEEGPSQTTLMWYAAIGFGTLLAYSGWVALLEEL